MRRHNRRLFRLARGLVWNDAEAEDVLQESYVRAYARLGDLADGQALAAWLARIVANEALGRRRSAARVVSLEEHRARGRVGDDGEDDTTVASDPASDQPDPERLAASGELRRLLEAAVDALPEEFRTVFVLREVEGLSTAETAACLAIRPETVKTRLHRARRQLQESLGERLLAASPSLFAFDGARCDRIVGRVLARLARPAAVGIQPALGPYSGHGKLPRPGLGAVARPAPDSVPPLEETMTRTFLTSICTAAALLGAAVCRKHCRPGPARAASMCATGRLREGERAGAAARLPPRPRHALRPARDPAGRPVPRLRPRRPARQHDLHGPDGGHPGAEEVRRARGRARPDRRSVDLYYNAGHPGVEKPHYHVVLWHVREGPGEAAVGAVPAAAGCWAAGSCSPPRRCGGRRPPTSPRSGCAATRTARVSGSTRSG